MRNGVHSKQFYQRPIPPLVGIDHQKIDSVAVFLLDGSERGSGVFAVLAPGRPKVDQGGFAVGYAAQGGGVGLHVGEDFDGRDGMGELVEVVGDGESEGCQGYGDGAGAVSF